MMRVCIYFAVSGSAIDFHCPGPDFHVCSTSNAKMYENREFTALHALTLHSSLRFICPGTFIDFFWLGPQQHNVWQLNEGLCLDKPWTAGKENVVTSW